MFDNMPSNTFFFYVVVFWVQFVIVIGYALWWYCQPDPTKINLKKNNKEGGL